MPKNLFSDYDGFVEKFKPKKTTDDCYTPEWLYDIVLDYVGREVMSLEGKNVVRPFWPGGDYEGYDYAEDDVVIDNPPFSIISQICAFYRAKRVPFFLFSPALTLGGLAKDSFTAVVVGTSVTYANGAQVATSFVSNMYEGNPAIVVDGDLATRIKRGERSAKRETAVALPRYEMPDGVLTAARLQKIANAGISLRVERAEAKFIRALDSMRESKKAIFGGGG